MNLRNALTPARILDFLIKKYYISIEQPWTNALNQFEVTCLRSQAIDEETPHHGDRKEIAVSSDDFFSGNPLEDLEDLRHQAREVNENLRKKLESLPRDEWPEGWSISPEGNVLMPWSFSATEKLIKRWTGPEGER